MANSKIAIPAAAMIAIAAAWPGPSMANSSHPGVIAEVAVETSAANVIQTMADQAINELTDQTLADDVRRKKFVSLMDRYFAMDVVSRFVLGATGGQFPKTRSKSFLFFCRTIWP